ncbi:17191_t:CDS:1, partial [Funneliformis geosporum]
MSEFRKLDAWVNGCFITIQKIGFWKIICFGKMSSSENWYSENLSSGK